MSAPDLLLTKRVNSSFHGTPDLNLWFRGHGIQGFVLAGITTNHCCQTTARVGGNLGYAVAFALDATHTLDRTGPDGHTLTGDELARATATNLQGEYATIMPAEQILNRLSSVNLQSLNTTGLISGPRRRPRTRRLSRAPSK